MCFLFSNVLRKIVETNYTTTTITITATVTTTTINSITTTNGSSNNNNNVVIYLQFFHFCYDSVTNFFNQKSNSVTIQPKRQNILRHKKNIQKNFPLNSLRPAFFLLLFFSLLPQLPPTRSHGIAVAMVTCYLPSIS